MRDLSKHIAFTSDHEIREIVQPVFKHFNLQIFNFCRFYQSDSGNKINAPLTSNPDYLKETMKNIGAVHSRHVVGALQDLLIFQHAVPGIKHTPTRRIYEKQIAIQRDQFDAGTEIIIQIRHEGYSDGFHFTAKYRDHQALNRFLNNLDLLHHFTGYFYEKAADLLKKSDEQRIIYPDSVYNPNNVLENNPTPVDRNSFIQQHRLNRFRFINKLGQHQFLTEKEIECARELIKGKTAKQIADKFCRSPRTIESRIETLKQKTGCYSKSALIKFLMILQIPLL
jgi:DNA-binding CsgD family transcriptional regulator